MLSRRVPSPAVMASHGLYCSRVLFVYREKRIFGIFCTRRDQLAGSSRSVHLWRRRIRQAELSRAG